MALGLQRQAIVALVVHALLALAAMRVELTQTLHARFLPDDPALLALEEEQALFGIGESVAVLVETRAALADVIEPSRLREWSDQLATLDGVASVATVLDVPMIDVDEGGARVSTLADEPAPLAAARTHPLAVKTFLAPSGRGTVIALGLEPELTTDLDRRRALAASLDTWTRALVRTDGDVDRAQAVGTLPLHAAAVREAYRDIVRIAPPLLIALLVLLRATIGSVGVALAVVGTALLNLSATLGTASIAGWSLSQFGFVFLPIVLTVGLLDGIHLALAYRGGLDADPTRSDRATAMGRAIDAMRAPCVWTSVTTAAGFAVLGLSTIPQIRQLGSLAAVGTLWALLTSFMLLPAVLLRLEPSRGRASPAPARWSRIGVRYPATVVAVTMLALAATAPGVGRVAVFADFPRLFDEEHPLTLELERTEREWGGIASVSFLLEPRTGVDPTGPRVAERLATFGRLLAARELITHVISPLDVRVRGAAWTELDPAMLAQARARDDGSGVTRPPTTAGLASLVDPASGTFRIVARIRMMHPELFPALVADLEGFRTDLDDLFHVRLTGWPLVFKNLEQRLLDELLESFAVAFLVVALLLLAAVGRPRLWLLALIPNLAPLCIVLGTLGWTAIGFTSGLLLAPGIALGLVVDDSIHLLIALRRADDATLPTAAVVERALDAAGPALTATSAVLVTGFGLLCLSAFRGNRTLGAVMVCVATTAWVADMVVLPALLVLLGRRRDAHT